MCVCVRAFVVLLTHKGCHMLAYFCTSKGGIRIESSRGEFSFRFVSFSFSFAFLFFFFCCLPFLLSSSRSSPLPSPSHVFHIFLALFPAPPSAVCHEPLPSPSSSGSVIMFHPSSCCSCKSAEVLGLGLNPGRARVAKTGKV